MELFIFARFHAREGDEAAVAAALRDVVVPTRAEPGCLAINAFRSVRDPRLFYIHSRWIDETAFDIHAELPHTVAFLAAGRGAYRLLVLDFPSSGFGKPSIALSGVRGGGRIGAMPTVDAISYV